MSPPSRATAAGLAIGIAAVGFTLRHAVVAAVAGRLDAAAVVVLAPFAIAVAAFLALAVAAARDRGAPEA